MRDGTIHTPEYIEAFYDGVHETLRQLQRDLGGDPDVDEWVAARSTELAVDAEQESHK